MSPVRTVVTLDPALELEDFQAAARMLIAYGIVTERYPEAGVLALVRRFEEPLRREFSRLCHWRLDVGPSCARLLRRPSTLSVNRPARTATQSRRAFSPQAYASLCMVLAALERLGGQTTISRLADEVARLRAGDEHLPFDLTQHGHRRAFVDAVAWLEQRGVLGLLDGDTETFVSGTGDALYDVDQDAASWLLLSPPSVLSGLREPSDFLVEAYPPTVEGAQARARHRVHRRLLTETALYYDELPEDERDFARQRRIRIREDLERLSGRTLECRAEGLAVIGLPSGEVFPAAGAVAQAALLFSSELVSSALDDASSTPGGPDSGPGERPVAPEQVRAAWNRVLVAYGGRFTAEFRAEPQRLEREALMFLERLELLVHNADGSVMLRPAIARYRSEIRLPEAFDV